MHFEGLLIWLGKHLEAYWEESKCHAMFACCSIWTGCRHATSFSTSQGWCYWIKTWQPTPVSLPGKFHGQSSLVGYSPWGHKELDMTEATEHMQAYVVSSVSYWQWHRRARVNKIPHCLCWISCMILLKDIVSSHRKTSGGQHPSRSRKGLGFCSWLSGMI